MKLDIGVITTLCATLVAQSYAATPLWDAYLTEVTGTNIQPACMPEKLVPSGQPKGIIALFHGYTACPDSYSTLAPVLQEDYVVLNFLTVGHGRLRGDCGSGTDCVSNTPLELLPTSFELYLKFIQKANLIVEETMKEFNLSSEDDVVGALGLSLGGPLSITAAAEGSDLYNRLFTVDAFLGISVPPLDSAAATCVGDVRSCAEKFVQSVLDGLPETSVAEKGSDEAPASKDVVSKIGEALDWFFQETYGTDVVFGGYSQLQSNLRFMLALIAQNDKIIPQPIKEMLLKQVDWGKGCDDATELKARGGYCTMRVKHLLGAHSLATYALSRISDVGAEKIQMINVERDGFTRNGIMFGVLKFLESNSNVGMCMFQLEANCDVSTGTNDCGVPHSCMSAADNELISPFELYWTENLNAGISNWFNSDAPDVKMGVTRAKGDAIDRATCYAIDMTAKPSADLFGRPPKYATMTVSGTGLTWGRADAELVWSKALLSKINIPESGDGHQLIILRADGDATSGTVFLEMSDDVIDALVRVAGRGGLNHVLGITVTGIFVEGKHVYAPNKIDEYLSPRQML